MWMAKVSTLFFLFWVQRGRGAWFFGSNINRSLPTQYTDDYYSQLPAPDNCYEFLLYHTRLPIIHTATALSK